MEKQLLLRLPEALALNVQQMLNESKLSNKFEIQFSSATEGVFMLDDKFLPCHLVELPCVIESQKSFDLENFYKSADIHQMIVVTEPDAPVPPIRFPSGLTPPTKDIVPRRFQRFPKPTPASLQETENALQLISSKEEVVTEEVKVEEIEEEIADDWEEDDEPPPLEAGIGQKRKTPSVAPAPSPRAAPTESPVAPPKSARQSPLYPPTATPSSVYPNVTPQSHSTAASTPVGVSMAPFSPSSPLRASPTPHRPDSLRPHTPFSSSSSSTATATYTPTSFSPFPHSQPPLTPTPTVAAAAAAPPVQPRAAAVPFRPESSPGLLPSHTASQQQHPSLGVPARPLQPPSLRPHMQPLGARPSLLPQQQPLQPPQQQPLPPPQQSPLQSLLQQQQQQQQPLPPSQQPIPPLQQPAQSLPTPFSQPPSVAPPPSQAPLPTTAPQPPQLSALFRPPPPPSSSFTLPTPPPSLLPTVLPSLAAVATAPAVTLAGIPTTAAAVTAAPTAAVGGGGGGGQDSELGQLEAQIAAHEEKLKMLTNPLMKKNVLQMLENLRAQRAKLL